MDRAARYNRDMFARSGGAAQPAHAAVKRELLVRYLDSWAPVALQRARVTTYAERCPDNGGSAADRLAADEDGTAVAALRVFGEFPELLARHRLTVLVTGVAGDRVSALSSRLDEVLAELGRPAGLGHQVTSDPLVVVLRSAGALSGPVFVYVDAVGATPPAFDELVTLGAGRRTELLLAVDTAAAPALAGGDSPADQAAWPTGHPIAEGPPRAAGGELARPVDRVRAALGQAGFQYLACVELVDTAGTGQLLIFGTGSAKHLTVFKEAMWAVDEYAGVRYRDPGDPDRALLDISLRPPVGPLKRELLRRVGQGPCTVAQLRDFALTETVYRAADVLPALTSLLGAGALTRDPLRGRLTAETVIGPARKR